MKKLVLIMLLLFARESYSQWESLNKGLYGGSVNALLPIDGAVLAGTKGGIYRSTNQGKYWEKTAVVSGGAKDFLKFNDKIIAATYSGIFISTDNGKAWIQSKDQSRYYTSLTSLKGSLFAGSWEKGVFRSTDEGETWVAANTGLKCKNVRALITIGDILLAGTNDGIFRSTDGGENWNFISLGYGNFSHVNDFEFLEGKVFAATYLGYKVSTDSGATWENKNILNSGKSFDKITSKNGLLVAANSMYTYISSDIGNTWVQKMHSIDAPVYSIAFDGDNLLIGASVFGIYLSNNLGDYWNAINTGLTSVNVTDIAINNEDMFVVNGNCKLFYSSDRGDKWNPSSSTINSINAIEFFDNKLFADFRLFGIFSTSDNGLTWAQNHDGEENSTIITFAKNKDKLYAGGSVLCQYLDDVYWTKISADPINNITSILPLEGIIYLASNGIIYLSTDEGFSWQEQNKGGPGSVRILASYNDNILAVSHNGVFFTSDSGENWINRFDGLTNPRVEAIGTYENTIILGTEAGVFLSSDEGLTWQNKTGDLPDSSIFSIQINGQYIYVGTSANGLYRAKLSDLGIKGVEDTRVTNSLKLFPNPASEYLTIELTEESAATEKIVISDLLGNVVLETPRSGSNQQRIDISRLLPGAYSITCGGKRQTFMVVR